MPRTRSDTLMLCLVLAALRGKLGLQALKTLRLLMKLAFAMFRRECFLVCVRLHGLVLFEQSIQLLIALCEWGNGCRRGEHAFATK